MIAALGPMAFSILIWGVIGLVLAILAYEVYVLSRDFGRG